MTAWIENLFNSRRKVDSELAATTSVGSVFQMCAAATAKARLPTVDSLTRRSTLVTALLRVARVTGGLVESNGSPAPGL